MGTTDKFKSSAHAALQQGRAAQWIPRLRRRLLQSPADATLHELLGVALESVGQRNAATRELQEATRLAPGRVHAWVTLGSVLSRARKFDEAIAAYRHATTLSPGDASTWRQLGHALRRQGRIDDATSALHRALQVTPGEPAASFDLGLACWQAGRLHDALPHLESSLAQAPDEPFHRAAVDSVRAELEAPVHLAPIPGTLRVALHMNRPFHYHVLHPLFRALVPRHAVRLAGEPAFIQGFQPDVIVCADAQGRRLRELCPRATIVFVRHGLISKQHLGIAAGGCDYVAGISSETVRDDIVAREHLPPERLWVTGHVALDPLFRGLVPPLPPGLLAGSRTVLYAPTWNPRLSSLRLLGDDPVTAIRGADEDINLIIKPHPLVSREQADLLRLLRRATHGRRNVWLVEDAAADALTMLPHADLLLSDASSVILAYLALDRPLVLINHPDRSRDPGFDPGGMEWRWRDMGEQVERIPDLPSAIVQALAQPGARAAQRAGYRRQLFGDLTDGCAAERIAARIESLPRAGTP